MTSELRVSHFPEMLYLLNGWASCQTQVRRLFLEEDLEFAIGSGKVRNVLANYEDIILNH